VSDDVERLAARVAAALEAADAERFADLLDPDVTWGAPGDPTPECRNRQQVLAWYRHGREAGRRAEIRGVTTHGDKILVAMTVTPEQIERWQVLTVADGRVTDIRGYDDEADATAALG